MMRKWRVPWTAAILAVAGASVPACGGPSSSGGGCRYQGWQGQCALTNVRTARVIERFPKSFVVIEATYEPQSSGNVFAPPPFRKEIMAPAEFEQDASNHLRNQPSVPCSVLNPVGDPCSPRMTASVSEFVPPSGAPVVEGPKGCAKIEHTDSAALAPAPVTLPGPFQFEENSSADSPEHTQMAAEAARRIQSDPRIECVAIKAKTSPGEPFTLANDRAQLVRRLLEARGIERSRLIVFEATAPTYTAQPDQEQPAASEQRRVFLTVVVYTK